MRVIWKYHLPDYPGEVDIEMPSDSKILDIQVQHGKPVMWVMVETASHPINRNFKVYASGEQVFEDAGDYKGTWQTVFGLVWHLFEMN